MELKLTGKGQKVKERVKSWAQQRLEDYAYSNNALSILFSS
jgi:hypothetical protein